MNSYSDCFSFSVSSRRSCSGHSPYFIITWQKRAGKKLFDLRQNHVCLFFFLLINSHNEAAERNYVTVTLTQNNLV